MYVAFFIAQILNMQFGHTFIFTIFHILKQCLKFSEL